MTSSEWMQLIIYLLNSVDSLLQWFPTIWAIIIVRKLIYA
jgi:hypothetical protein